MVDQERVCCMCGDVGFPDKLFQCSRCCFRLQHLYCSNYYYGNEAITASTTLCDWCLSEGRNSSSTNSNTNKHHIKRSSSSLSSTSSSSMDNHHIQVRSEFSTGERVKQHEHQTGNELSSPRERGASSSAARNSGIPSPRTAHRRYKLLKDVMC